MYPPINSRFQSGGIKLPGADVRNLIWLALKNFPIYCEPDIRKMTI